MLRPVLLTARRYMLLQINPTCENFCFDFELRIKTKMNINTGSILSNIFCKIFCIKLMPNESRNGPARYWMLTIPRGEWEPNLPEGVSYIKGKN